MNEPRLDTAAIERGFLPAPAAFVVDIELTDAEAGLSAFRDLARASAHGWVLVRQCTEPVGFVEVDMSAGPPDDQALLALLRAACAPRLAGPGPSQFLASRRRVLAEAEHMTVVVCTRERPAGLRRALMSLAVQDYPSFEVVVIDNSPTTAATADVVRDMARDLAVRYVVEPRPGLSRARNRALTEIDRGLIAWLDDDEEADPHWLAELARGFADHPGASAVSGVVVPAELRTRAQMWFEQFGGHSKGRGFVTVVFSPASRAVQDPLYPLPPFGVGANMAFRAEALHAIGGFDEALGAGTRTSAGEDTKVFSQLLRRGHTTVYQHSALTRHYHREDLAGLGKQLAGYGVGLTAFYTSMIVDNPAVLFPLARLAPRAYRDMSGGGRLEQSHLGSDFPTELLGRNVRGMVTGPARYLLTRWDQRREARRTRSTGTNRT